MKNPISSQNIKKDNLDLENTIKSFKEVADNPLSKFILTRTFD